MFKKEVLDNLVKAYKDDKDVLEMIYDSLESMSSYVKAVNSMENTITVLRFKMDPEEYHIRVQELDRNRKIIHDGVISSIKFLNRISNVAHLPLFYSGDVDDRYEVATFAGEVVKEIFDNRQ